MSSYEERMEQVSVTKHAVRCMFGDVNDLIIDVRCAIREGQLSGSNEIVAYAIKCLGEASERLQAFNKELTGDE